MWFLTVPSEMARGLLERAVADYEAAYRAQEASISGLPEHLKGELLLGLADGYNRLGRWEEAEPHFARLVAEVPDSGYGAEARAFMTAGPGGLTRPARICQGCHVP